MCIRDSPHGVLQGDDFHDDALLMELLEQLESLERWEQQELQ